MVELGIGYGVPHRLACLARLVLVMYLSSWSRGDESKLTLKWFCQKWPSAAPGAVLFRSAREADRNIRLSERRGRVTNKQEARGKKPAFWVEDRHSPPSSILFWLIAHLHFCFPSCNSGVPVSHSQREVLNLL